MALHRSLALLGAAALAVTAAGCAERDGGGQSDAAAVDQAIKADEKKWNAEFKAKDVEGLIAHYADGAYFIAPGAPPATGSTEIRKTFANALSDRAFAVNFASDRIDVAASGDLAYSRGHFTTKYTDPKTGKVMTENGSYIAVYKKQQDGSWKVVEDFAVGDPSTRKEVPPEKPATRAKMVSF